MSDKDGESTIDTNVAKELEIVLSIRFTTWLVDLFNLVYVDVFGFPSHTADYFFFSQYHSIIVFKVPRVMRNKRYKTAIELL